MITVEAEAKDKIKTMIEAEKRPESGLRIKITGRAASGYQHALSFVDPGQETAEDHVVEADGIKFFLDPFTASHIDGTVLKFIDDIYGGGFKVENPNVPAWDDPRSQKIQQIIDERVNPALAMHGGYVELVEVRGEDVFVNFGGGCQGCGMADVTMKQGIETMLREELPDIGHIYDATDHASGANPYYRPSK